MKKLFLGLLISMLFISCSSMEKGSSLEQKYNITKASAKEWDKTIINVIEGEALIEDWYGDENPIMYLRKTGKMSEKDFQFLLSLEKKDVTEITDDEYGKFLDLVTKYNKKMPRKFFLENENIKDPKGLVDRMVRESFVRMPNPSNHIKDVVATEDEWNKIVEYSKQTDLSEKDTKQLRKLLNKFIKRDEFFSTEVWYNREVSARMIKIANINAKENKTAIEKNISILEARKHCNQEVLDLRKAKNSSSGYWILELNEEAVEHCIYGKIKIINNTSIYLTSDGFSQYYDTFDLANGYEEFIDIVKDSNIDELYNKLYDKQEEDSQCNNFPRLKKRDDASIIYFEIE